MSYHIDAKCEQAYIHLNDAICSFERATEREYTLVLIPHNPVEKVLISQNGKPFQEDSLITANEIVTTAMQMRERDH